MFRFSSLIHDVQGGPVHHNKHSSRYMKVNKIMQNLFFMLQPFFTCHEYRITVCDGRSQESSTKTTGVFDSGT